MLMVFVELPLDQGEFHEAVQIDNSPTSCYIYMVTIIFIIWQHFLKTILGVGRICSFKQFPVETFGNEISLYNTIREPGANSLCFDGFCYCFCFTECSVFLYRTDQQEGSTYKPIQLYTANKAVSYTDQNALYHKATLKNCISNLAEHYPDF